MHNTAKVRKRVAAALIDYTMYFILLFAYVILLGVEGDDGVMRVEGMMALPLILVWFIYFPVVEGFGGQTLGKRIIGIRIVGLKGEDVGVGTTTIRRFLDLIDMSFAGILGVIIMKASSQTQRLGDHVAGTLVIDDQLTRCQYCDAELALNAYELSTGVFVCPKCKQQNFPLDFVSQ
jgi:uncharacterized RDD family membrane protein YckC